MKISISKCNDQGYAILLVVLFSAINLLVLGGIMDWSSSRSNLTTRNNNYYANQLMAEAAVDKVIGHMRKDYEEYGPNIVSSRLFTYRRDVPTSRDDPELANYEFSDTLGGKDRILVSENVGWGFRELKNSLLGLSGYSVEFKLAALARDLRLPDTQKQYDGISKNVVMAYVPVFQYGVFYNLDLEINPSTDFTLNGRVHSNGDIYIAPKRRRTLLLNGSLSSAGGINIEKHPLDPVWRKNIGEIKCQGEVFEKSSSMSLPLPLGTRASVARELVEQPPAGESRTSDLGKLRLYNQADLIVILKLDPPDSDKVIPVATSGAYDNFSTLLPWSKIDDFIKLDNSFFDKRENKFVLAAEIDIEKLGEKMKDLKKRLGRTVKSIYIADERSPNAIVMPAIRLVNGEKIPKDGLTIVTPNPLYTLGDYNSSGKGAPAAIICDAFTVLSSKWRDSNSTQSLRSRRGDDTTIRAGIITGVVPSDGYYFRRGR